MFCFRIKWAKKKYSVQHYFIAKECFFPQTYFSQQKQTNMVHQGSTVVWSYKILHRYPEEALREWYKSAIPPTTEISFSSLLAAYVNLEHNVAKKATIEDQDFERAAKGSKISGPGLKSFWQAIINHDPPPFFSDSDEED